MFKKLLITFSVIILLGAIFLVIMLVRNNSTNNSSLEINTQVNRPEFPQEFMGDKDQDGLSAEQEAELGTSDLETDSDGDGLSDFEEVNNTKTDPTKLDTDDDGFADYVEILNGHNPRQK